MMTILGVLILHCQTDIFFIWNKENYYDDGGEDYRKDLAVIYIQQQQQTSYHRKF